MKQLGILFIALFSSCLSFFAYSQEIQYRIISQGLDEAKNITLYVDPDDLGRVKGRIMSSGGNEIAGATVVIHDGLNFNGNKSRKGGDYVLGVHFGTHIIEVTAPGYRKFRGEVDVPKGNNIEMNIVMEPAFDGIADIKSAGNGLMCKGNAMNFTVNARHPAYEGKTMLDVLRDVPMVDIGDSRYTVTGKESADFYINGKPFKAPYATALKFFSSIDAAKVKSVRVMTLGPKASVSISYDE